MSLSSGHGISSGDLNTGDNLSESSFLEALFGLELGHADFADDADFFAAHLSPITIYWKKFGKMLIAKGFICVTAGLKWGFIPHASLTILALSLTILLMLLSKKAFLAIENGFTCFWSKFHFELVWGSDKDYVGLY